MSVKMPKVGARRWLYMAKVIIHELDIVIDAEEIKINSFSKGVHEELKDFFKSVNYAINYNHNVPLNSFLVFKSLLCFSISSKILTDLHPQTTRRLNGLHKELERYIGMVALLEKPGSLDSASISCLEQLRVFFEQIVEIAKNEIYQEQVGCG